MAYALRVGKKMPDISICLPGGERIDIKVRDSIKGKPVHYEG